MTKLPTTVVTDKVTAFFAQYPAKQYDKGQIIIFAGDAPAGVFLVESGSVGQYDINTRGDKIIVNIFKSDAFFPMSWAMNPSPNLFFYEALTPVRLVKAPAEAVVAFVDSNPDVLKDLLLRIYQGLDGILLRMVQLMGGSARSRVAIELLITLKRFGKKQAAGNYKLSLNERDIAARTGLTRETVNREIRKLKDEQQLEVVADGIIIKSLSQLEETAKS